MRRRSICFGDYLHLDPECKSCSCKEHCIGVQLSMAIDEQYDKEYEQWKEGSEAWLSMLEESRT